MNQTWLVTDATCGLGRQIIRQLLERGDRVAAIAANPLLLQDLKVFHTTALHLYRVEAGDIDGMRRTLDKAFSDLGTVDVVLSHADHAVGGAALPHLQAQGHGHVISLTGEDTVVHGVLGFDAVDDGRGDPAKAATTVIESADAQPAPVRRRHRPVEPGTTLTPEQFRRLVPGLWGVPHPA